MSNYSRSRVWLWSTVLAGLAISVAGLTPPSAAETRFCTGVLTSDLASNSSQGAQIGWAVDADGTWLVGGAPFASPGGAIVMFEGPPDTSQKKEPLAPPSDLQAGDRFGFSVSIDDGWMAVGAPSGDGRVRDSGVVYLYRLEGSAWTWSGLKLEATDAARDAQFGFSVSLRGNRLVVGAPNDADIGTRAGSAYVFEGSGTTWNPKPVIELHANDGRPFDLFGSAVAIDADTLVIGAPFADDIIRLLNFGAAYVFKRDPNDGWNAQSQKKLTAGDFRGDNIQFGASVAIHGGRIAVGAPGEDAPRDSGSAFVFEWNGASWDRHDLRPGDRGAGEQFGTSVDLDATHLAVGARLDGESGPESGAAYTFRLQTWTEERKLIVQPAAGAAFGQSVAILDDKVYPGGPLYSNTGAIAVCPTGDGGGGGGKVNVSIAKTADRGSVCPEDTLTYKILAKNAGSNAAENVTVHDVSLPIQGLQDVRWTCTPRTICTHASGLSTLEETVNLPVDGEVLYKIFATVVTNAQGTITNEAEIKLPSNVENTGSPTTATAVTEVLPPGGDLEVKITPPASLSPGDIAEYEVTVTNRGRGIAKKVKLIDHTTGGTERRGPFAPNCDPDTSDLLAFVCNLGNILPNDPVTRKFFFKVDEDCPLPERIVNIAEATFQELGECDISGSAKVTTPVDSKANLEILTFEDAPDPVAPGGTITYQLEVKNLGPNPACDVILHQSVTGGMFLGSTDTCEPLGSSEVVCSIAPELAKDDTVSLETMFQAPDPCPGDHKIHSEAKVSSDTAESDASNNEKETETACQDVELAIDKKGSPASVAPGQKVTYTITAKNIGTRDAEGVVVKDSPPDGLTGVEWCRGQGCSPSISQPLVKKIDLPVGGSEVFRLRGTASQCGPLKNKASAEHPLAETVEAEATTQVEGLALFCAIDGVTVEGSMITKTCKLINCGPARPDDVGDEFTDALPPSLTLVSASADSGTTGTAGNTATWNGSLDEGQTVTIQVTATINLGTACTVICNQATAFGVLSDDPEEPGDTDPCCFSVFSVLCPSEIPTLSDGSALALILLLTAFALRRLRTAR